MSSGITHSGIQIYQWSRFFVEGVDEIKFEKSMQIKKALFVGMTLLRKSLDVVMSAVGV